MFIWFLCRPCYTKKRLAPKFEIGVKLRFKNLSWWKRTDLAEDRVGKLGEGDEELVGREAGVGEAWVESLHEAEEVVEAEGQVVPAEDVGESVVRVDHDADSFIEDGGTERAGPVGQGLPQVHSWLGRTIDQAFISLQWYWIVKSSKW